MDGKEIGRYHILEQLGQGGMATVYKAYDTHLERMVALKLIRTDAFPPNALSRILQRFEREAKALARLSHPSIVKVYDFGEYNGAPYLVMEYHRGGTLKQYLGKPLPWQTAFSLMIPIARALAYAHEHGVIHRDVKPSNILISETGEPHLTDFGIAKILEDDEGNTLTGTGVGIGTPEYMSPEQGISARQIDGRSDVYSLGVVLFELLTGRKPYLADTPMAVVLKHHNDPLPRPRLINPNIPETVERLIFKALAKKPDDRYENMTAFAVAMEDLMGTNPVTIPPVTRMGSSQTQNATMATFDDLIPAQNPSAAPRKPKNLLLLSVGILGTIALLLVTMILILNGIRQSSRNQVAQSFEATPSPISEQMETKISILLTNIPTAEFVSTEAPSLPTPTMVPDVRETIRVAVDATFPPFEMMDASTGELTGFDIDLMNWVANYGGWVIEYVNVPFDQVLNGVGNCEYDAAISALVITSDREQYMNFSDPYINAGQVIIVRSGETSITSVNDLVGKRVAAQIGTTGQMEAEAISGVTFLAYDRLDLAIQDLVSGNSDAVITDNISAMQSTAQNNGTIRILDGFLSNESYGIAICSTNTEMLDRINFVLSTLQSDGTYDTLVQKWFLSAQ